MNVMMRICDTCAAFGPQIDSEELDSGCDGACRLNPPALLPVDDEGGFTTLFPSVNREDWCLGWTMKEEA